MQSIIYSYPAIVKEVYLDTFGHMNNAVYLVLFEEARWDLLNKNGYGLEKIRETQLGPTIMEIRLTYLKELRLRDEFIIQTQLISYKMKVARMQQEMVRAGEVCCRAEITFGLFSLKERRLVTPTADWLKAVGYDDSSQE